MANRGDFDGAVRPVIGGIVLILIVGFAWKFWYIALPLIVLVVAGLIALRSRNRRRRD